MNYQYSINMASKQINVQEDTLTQLEKEEGNSWTRKIDTLLKNQIKPNDSKDITQSTLTKPDLDKIKSIFESTLTEFKEGRL